MTDESSGTVSKRQVFISMGCAKFPYNKIKELFGEKNRIDINALAMMPILDDEKVQLIQKMDFFPPVLQRIAAFRFAKDTLDDLSKELSDIERMMVQKTYELLLSIFSGEKEYHVFDCERENIQFYIDNNLKTKGVDQCFKKIAAFEVLVALSRKNSKRALIEVSSIQRDVFGDGLGTRQLDVMLRLSRTYLEE